MDKPYSFIYNTTIPNSNVCLFFFFGSFSDRNSDARSFLRGLDVNRTPPSAAAAAATADCYEEENGVSSPNSTVSSISGKRSEREAALGGEEAEEGDRDSCSRGGGSDDDDGGNGSGDASRKKLRLTKDQSLVLEETFKEHNTLNPVSSCLRYYFALSQGYFGIFKRYSSK